MKSSELIQFLSSLPQGVDPEIVTGEEWLPEQLLEATFDGSLVNLHFDNAPEEGTGELDGRGFVEHELVMLKDKIITLMFDKSIEPKTKAEVFLQLFVLTHEKSSEEVIEFLEDPLSWQEQR